MTVGARIKNIRESKGMSQDELAKKMGYKDRSSISKIEKASDENITIESVQKFAEALNCSPLFLMGWDSDEKKQSSRDEIAFNVYSQLNDEQKTLIDNMLTALSSKS